MYLINVILKLGVVSFSLEILVPLDQDRLRDGQSLESEGCSGCRAQNILLVY
jgi:hypothetical protein